MYMEVFTRKLEYGKAELFDVVLQGPTKLTCANEPGNMAVCADLAVRYFLNRAVNCMIESFCFIGPRHGSVGSVYFTFRCASSQMQKLTEWKQVNVL